MFAVVKTGGKQYRVAPGDVVLVERLLGDEGQSITLDHVLMVSEGTNITVGAPQVAGASVEAIIKAQTRGDKIIVFKKRRRQGYRRKKGHRQDLTLLTIKASHGSAAPASTKEAKAVAAEAKSEGEEKPKAKAPRAKKTEKVEE